MREASAARIAVVNGAGRGVGRAIAIRLGDAVSHVVVSSRTEDDLDAVAADIGSGRATPVVADATKPEESGAAVQLALARFERVDILVTAVGGHPSGNPDVYEGDEGLFERTVDLNLFTAHRSIRVALPSMRRHGFGRIITIGSGASRRAVGSLGYTTAKHALIGYTRQLAAATGRDGITVN